MDCIRVILFSVLTSFSSVGQDTSALTGLDLYSGPPREVTEFQEPSSEQYGDFGLYEDLILIPRNTTQEHYMYLGGNFQRYLTGFDVGFGFRNNHIVVIPGIQGSFYKLVGTEANEYTYQAKISVQYEFLAYGFLEDYYPYTKAHYNWTPYVDIKLALGARTFENYYLTDLEEQGYKKTSMAIDMSAAVGVKYTFRPGWFTIFGEVGYNSSSYDVLGRDENYVNFAIGAYYIIGY